MKNFWLDRNKKREYAKKVEMINQIVRTVIKHRLGKKAVWQKRP